MAGRVARSGVAALMCAMAAACLAASARAQEPSGSASAPQAGPRSEFRLGLGGQPGQAVARPDTPLPFCLDVMPLEPDAGAGTLEIVRLPTMVESDIAERLLYRAALDLPPGRRRRITGYLAMLGDAAAELEARWVQHDGARLRSRTAVRFTAESEIVVLVTTTVPGRLAPYYPVRPSDASDGWTPSWRVAAVDLAAIRTSWTGLRIATCLVLDHPLDSAVDRAWIPAIRRWVEAGGTLVVTGGRAGREIAAPFRDLLPVAVLNADPQQASLREVLSALGSARATTTVDPDPQAPFTIAPTLQRHGTAIARNAAGVAAAIGDLGLGRVVWLGCDPHGPLARLARLGAGAVGVACEARGDDLRFSPITPAQTEQAMRAGWWRWETAQDHGDFGVAAQSISVPPPARAALIWSLLGWIGALALLLGGARRFGRAGTAWGLAVGCSVLGFAGVTAWAGLNFARRAKSAAITLSVGRLGAGSATTVAGPALYVPASATAELSLPANWAALVSPLDTRLEAVVPGDAPQGATARATLASRSTRRLVAFGETPLGEGVRLQWDRSPDDEGAQTLRVINGTPHVLRQTIIHTVRRPRSASTRGLHKGGDTGDDSDRENDADPDDDAPAAWYRHIISFVAPAIMPGETAEAVPLLRGNLDADLDALRRASMPAGEAAALAGAARRADAVGSFRSRGRNLAIALGTTVVVADLATPPAPMHLDGTPIAGEGEHLLFLVDAPAPAAAVASDLAVVRVRVRTGPLVSPDLRSRLDRAPRIERSRDGSISNGDTVFDNTSADLNAGLVRDIVLGGLPPLSWQGALRVTLDTTWKLAVHRRPAGWTGQPGDAGTWNDPGTFDVLGAHDVFTGALIPVRREGGEIAIASPRRFWRDGTLALRVRFRPPLLPLPAPPEAPPTSATPPPRLSWQGGFSVRALDARMERE